MEGSGKTWHSPLNASAHLNALAQKVGIQAIDTEGKYKRVREARSMMVATAYMYKRIGRPYYFRLVKDDPPDGIAMCTLEKSPETLQLTKVEISTYRSGTGETFLEQLKRKVPKDRHYFDPSYILLYDVQDHQGIDFEACRDYLNGMGADFPVWVQHVEQFLPDTVANVTFLNPDLAQIKVNVGEAVYELKQQNEPVVLFTKRAGSVEKVRVKKSKKYPHPPWEDLK